MTKTNGNPTVHSRRHWNLSWVLTGMWVITAGCSMMPTNKPQTPVLVTLPADDGIKSYFETMATLGNSDQTRQTEVFTQIERDYNKTPTPTTTLRYAVALVTPSHPGSNLADGKKLLETLLATPERLSSNERSLSAVLLQQASARIKAESEYRRLRATLDERSRSQANSDKRVQALVDDNARLRRDLAEVEQKLNRIKEIERRSLIERSPASPANRDSATPSETQSPPPSR